MRWLELRRAWPVAAFWSAVCLTAAVGGRSHGEEDPRDAIGAAGSLDGTYQLVSIDDEGVPAIAQMENCTPSRFRGGSMRLARDGTWRFAIDWNDENGAHLLRDQGRYRLASVGLSLHSDQYGDGFGGSIEGDVVVLSYDFCGDGHPDVELVFAK